MWINLFARRRAILCVNGSSCKINHCGHVGWVQTGCMQALNLNLYIFSWNGAYIMIIDAIISRSYALILNEKLLPVTACIWVTSSSFSKYINSFPFNEIITEKTTHSQKSFKTKKFFNVLKRQKNKEKIKRAKKVTPVFVVVVVHGMCFTRDNWIDGNFKEKSSKHKNQPNINTYFHILSFFCAEFSWAILWVRSRYGLH